MLGELRRQDHETHIDHLVRLFEHKDEYNLTCPDIADIMNEADGTDFNESTFRKYYKAFDEGRQYERVHSDLTRAGVYRRILCVSDLHVPFHLPLSTFAPYAGKVDVLHINGDVVDCAAISKFPKSYRSNTMDDIILARQYLIDLIEMIDPQQVVCNYGNHDIRFENFLAKKLGNDLVELMPRTPLELIFTDGFSHYNKNTRAKSWYDPLEKVFPTKRIIENRAADTLCFSYGEEPPSPHFC